MRACVSMGSPLTHYGVPCRMRRGEERRVTTPQDDLHSCVMQRRVAEATEAPVAGGVGRAHGLDWADRERRRCRAEGRQTPHSSRATLLALLQGPERARARRSCARTKSGRVAASDRVPDATQHAQGVVCELTRLARRRGAVSLAGDDMSCTDALRHGGRLPAVAPRMIYARGGEPHCRC